jgi:hypothetical protein
MIADLGTKPLASTKVREPKERLEMHVAPEKESSSRKRQNKS